MDKMKTAWLWVVNWNTFNGRRAEAVLFFSSREEFLKLLPWGIDEQLVEVKVHEDFDDWDYIPDNY